MTSTWLIVLLVVVWLLVLVPMIVNTREPIRRTSKAFSETRVLHRGDEKKLSPRRIISPRPVNQDISDESDAIIEDPADSQERNITVAAKAQQNFIQATLPFDEEFISDMDAVTEEIPLTTELISESLDIYEDVSAEDVLEETTEEVIDEVEGEIEEVDEVEEAVEETVSDSLEADTAADATIDEDVLEEDLAEEVAEDLTDDEVAEETSEEISEDTVDDTDEDAADLGVEAAEAVAYAEATEDEDSPTDGLTGKLAHIISGFKKSDRNIPNPAPQMALDAEDIAYAERRRGRGGFDPVADQEAATKRYRRRGIIFLAMLVLFIPAIVTAAVYGGFVWIAPVVWLGVIAFYLTALRSQVQLEKQLRAKRIARLRQARHEHIEYEQDREAGLDTSFRGQYLLVDTDDGDPVFEHLDTENFMTGYIAEHASEFTYDESGYLRDQFGKVHLNPEHYPDGMFGEDPRRARTADATPAAPAYAPQDDTYAGYYDPYSPAQYVGETSVDYWASEEEARTARRFEMPTNGDYLNVG